MKTIKKILWLLILQFLVILSAEAQHFGTDSLQTYLNYALENNPGIQAKYQEYKAALQKIPQAASLPDPELTFGLYPQPMEIVSGKQLADIQLMQMFPWFGTLKYAKEEMTLMAKAGYESVQDARLQLYYDVMKSWYELYKTQRNISNTQENIALLSKIEQLSLIKYKTGGSVQGSPSKPIQNVVQLSPQNASSMSGGNAMSGGMKPQAETSASEGMAMGSGSASSSAGGLSSVLRLQMEKAELENELEVLKQNRKTQLAGFNALLNRPAEVDIFVPDTMEIVSVDPTLLSLKDSFQGQPMLEMIRYESASIRAKSEMIKRMGYPMLGAGLSYSVINKSDMSTSMMNGKDMLMPMLKVSLPIYRSKYKAMKLENDANASASDSRYTEAANSLRTSYYEALATYYNQVRARKLYSTQENLMRKITDLSVRDFSVSGIGLADVLRNLQELHNYQLQAEEAACDVNTAVAYLVRLSGQNILSDKLKQQQ